MQLQWDDRSHNIASTTRAYLGLETLFSKSHDVVAAVDEDYFAGNSATRVGGEEDSGVADFFDFYAAAQWGALFVAFEHVAEAGDAAGGQRLNRAGGNGVHANLFLS